jgi:hypothetical protein
MLIYVATCFACSERYPMYSAWGIVFVDGFGSLSFRDALSRMACWEPQ